MAIYKPSLLDKFKDFVNGLKGNWDQYEAHVADFESHITATATDNVHGLAGEIIEESGSNDNGSWVRWSNGLQVCWIPSITLTYVNTGLLRASWTFPVAFKTGSIPACTVNPNQTPKYDARTAGTVVDCKESYCIVSALAPAGTFVESDTWNFQAVVIGWWK